jgi:hypothetical protein
MREALKTQVWAAKLYIYMCVWCDDVDDDVSSICGLGEYSKDLIGFQF